MRLFPLLLILISACDPIVASQMVLRPTPDAATPDSMHILALGLVDSIATSYGFIRQLGEPSCRVDYRGRGTVAANWLGEKRLSLVACVENEPPGRLQVVLQLMARSWTPKGDSVRRALAQAFETRFGAELVVVEPK